MDMEQDRIDRFWSKVDIKGPEDCWLWLASVTSKGYGSFAVAPKKTATAHKISWALCKNNGVMSDPKQHIMHLCDVKRCVNPNHLELGDAAQNNRDALARGVRVNRRPSDDKFCRNGHPRTPENTHPTLRRCLICMREQARRSTRNRPREVYNAYHRNYQRELAIKRKGSPEK